MKKIFTFLFFAGLIGSAASAQDRHAQYRNGAADNRNQSTVYQGGNERGYSQPSQNQPVYQGNNQRNNNNGNPRYDNSNGYGYNGNNRNYEDRGFRNTYRAYDRDGRMDREWYRRSHNRFFLSLSFGRHGRY
jgi:hypothetical protein